MLVQSHAGDIRLRLALPAAWPTGKISGLCALGGFEIDWSWTDDHLTLAVIRPNVALRCAVV